MTSPAIPETPAATAATQHDLTSLEGVLALLADMDPITRAQVSRVLAEHPVEFAKVRRAAIVEATRASSDGYATVAAALGVSTSAINKAIRVHNEEHGTSRRRRSPASGEQ